jgi:hypothetical protein
MDKYTAGKIEGMLLAARRQLEGVAEHLRQATPPDKLHDHVLKIARAMSELVDLSREIYAEHPELNPYLEEERTSAQRYAEYKRSKGRKPRST